MRLALSCALLVSAIGCAETRASESTPSPSDDDARPEVASDEASARDEARADPSNDGPAFDFRRVRTEPEAHREEPRICDVAFADARQTIEPRERALYPEDVTFRKTVRCEATTGGGWVEVIFDGADDANAVTAGRRVVLAPTAPSSGRYGYVVARFLRDAGEATLPAEARAEPPSPPPPLSTSSACRARRAWWAPSGSASSISSVRSTCWMTKGDVVSGIRRGCKTASTSSA